MEFLTKEEMKKKSKEYRGTHFLILDEDNKVSIEEVITEE